MSLQKDELDLGLGLNFPNQRIDTSLRNALGAGVNAGSRMNMTFVSAKPLSELVWSPQKGLSLKCADCTNFDKQPSPPFIDVGPSNIVVSPSENIKPEKCDHSKMVNEGKVLISQAAFHIDGKVSDQVSVADIAESNADTLSKIDGEKLECSNKIEDVNALGEGSSLQLNKEEECQRDCGRKDSCSPVNPKMVEKAETSGQNAGHENQKRDFLSFGFDDLRLNEQKIDSFHGKYEEEKMNSHRNRIDYVSRGIHELGLKPPMASGISTLKESEAFDCPFPCLPSTGKRQESALAMEEEVSNEMKTNGSSSKKCLQLLESTAEHNLQQPITLEECSESEGATLKHQSSAVKFSQTKKKILPRQNKGKGKALSDGDVSERVSNDEDGSQGSVESCNSAGLFSKGKKRGNLDQNFILGTKRSKIQIEDGSASRPYAGTDSTFINWISNMVKGLAKYNQDEVPPDHTLSCRHDGRKSHDQTSIGYNQNHGIQDRKMGFQSVFQSLYMEKTKAQETKRLDNEFQDEEPKKLALADEKCVNSLQLETKRVFFLPSGHFDPSMPGNDEGPSTHSQTAFANLASLQTFFSTNSAENKTSADSKCTKEKDGSSVSTSLGNNNIKSISNGEALHYDDGSSEPFRSLWITRYFPKKPDPSFNVNHCSHSTPRVLDYSAAGTQLISCDQACVNCSIDQKISEAKDYDGSNNLQNNIGYAETSLCKSRPDMPSQKFKSSEALSALFSRRLDALKNILQSERKDGATCSTTTTCLFCGSSDHGLSNCSRITEAELEELLKTIRAYDGAEAAPYFCIKCLCFGHWAMTCPMSSFSQQQQSREGGSFAHHQTALQLYTSNKRKFCIREVNEHHPCFMYGRNKLQVDAAYNMKPKWFGKLTSDHRRIFAFDEAQDHLASHPFEPKLKENEMVHCDFVGWKISTVPKETFDAIRSLRLSRISILKLLDSEISISRLEGFFLRLRLKKKEGFEGTGYQVASISGTDEEKSFTNANALSVTVGDVKCKVEWRYISNNDFLEDELMAWWCSTLASGGKIPSMDEVKSKLSTRNELGF